MSAFTSYGFKGFPWKKEAQKMSGLKATTSIYEGVAMISAVGPDYEGPETWVLTRFNAQDSKKQALPEDAHEALADWLARLHGEEISRLIKGAKEAAGDRS